MRSVSRKNPGREAPATERQLAVEEHHVAGLGGVGGSPSERRHGVSPIGQAGGATVRSLTQFPWKPNGTRWGSGTCATYPRSKS